MHQYIHPLDRRYQDQHGIILNVIGYDCAEYLATLAQEDTHSPITNLIILAAAPE